MPLAMFETFESYSALHAAVLGVFAFLTAAFVALGRRWRGTPRGRKLDLALGWATLLIWVWMRAFKILPGRWDPQKALPLHICDWVEGVAPFAIFTSWRPLRAVLYFWALGLSSQAFIQPDLREGPADFSFWVFWVSHASVVGLAVYDVAVRGYRPTWKDYGFAMATLVGYVAVVLPLDLIFGLNYGYVGPGGTGQPSLLDLMGPWPGRLVPIILLVAAVLALMVVPWKIAERVRRGKRGGRRLSHASEAGTDPPTRDHPHVTMPGGAGAAVVERPPGEGENPL